MSKQNIKMLVGDNGIVYYASLNGSDYKEINSLDDLKTIIESSNIVYCENITARMSSGDSLLEELMQMFPKKELIHKIIIIKRDSLTEETDCIPIKGPQYFDSRMCKLNKDRNFKSVGTAFTPFETLVSSIKLTCLMDHIELDRILKEEDNYSIRRSDCFGAPTLRSKFVTGVGEDGSALALQSGERYSSMKSSSKEIYIISLAGFLNKSRYRIGWINQRNMKSIRETLVDAGFPEYNLDEPLKYINKAIIQGKLREFFDRTWLDSVQYFKTTEKTSDCHYLYNLMIYNIIQYIKSRLKDVMIYEISYDNLSIAFKSSINVKTALNIVYQAVVSCASADLYDNICIENMRSKVSGMTRYWDRSEINVASFQSLSDINKIGTIKNLNNKVLEGCLVLSQLKVLDRFSDTE